jgi:GNAT superfamily N-acetyltransferase
MPRSFARIKYYLKLAVKRPNLILSFIFKKHLGVILMIPIDKRKEFLGIDSDVKIVRSNNEKEIYEFYKNKRGSVNKENIKMWLDNNFDCFLVYSSVDKVIGGMWIFKKKFTLKNTSGRTLSSKNTIFLNEGSLYGAYVIIDEAYRGRGINQLLLRYVINYYANKNEHQRLLLITGASNGAYIRTTMKNNGKLIGITEVTNILGLKHRKELFLDGKEKVWGNGE